jgi:hypothetical protein
MKRIMFAHVLFAILAFAACSGQSPAAPAPALDGLSATAAKTPVAIPGIYRLTFNTYQNGIYTEVASLPVDSDELILKAYVSDGAGAPAQSGTVTFEYCSYKGGPPNDITRADEAPKEACEQGTASWARLTSMTVDAGRCPALGVGYACMNFGVVHVPRDVGFRFRYSAQKSAIASGTSEARNFTWTSGS